MASIREIKTRINSIKSTAKTTKALQLVSATRMQKAQDRSKKSQLYAETLYEIVNRIGNIKDYKSPFLKIVDTRKIKNVAIVVVGTDRGFVGSMISNLTSETYQLKKNLEEEYSDIKIHGISIHKTGLKILHNAGIESEAHFAEYKDYPDRNTLSAVFKYLIDKFTKEEFDGIYLVYSKFINTITQKPKQIKVLPINVEINNNEIKSNSNPFLFEPSESEILDWLLPEYFETTLYTALLSSIAAEYSSRMVAMKNATDNANDLITGLTLKYNKTRQANITQQIIEVVSGSIE